MKLSPYFWLRPYFLSPNIYYSTLNRGTFPTILSPSSLYAVLPITGTLLKTFFVLLLSSLTSFSPPIITISYQSSLPSFIPFLPPFLTQPSQSRNGTLSSPRTLNFLPTSLQPQQILLFKLRKFTALLPSLPHRSHILHELSSYIPILLFVHLSPPTIIITISYANLLFSSPLPLTHITQI